ncbi:NADP-dependent oxidoreductase domain-containing protein [Mycena polygramma]|nr:NADP-dependent oxidoreductase domain-containing protein [Mycena polygramma]
MSTKSTSNVGVVFGAMIIAGPPRGPSSCSTPSKSTVTLKLIPPGCMAAELLGAIGWQERGLQMKTKVLATKGKGMGWATPDELTHSPADLRKAINASLAALKADKIHIYYLHAPDRSVPYEDTLREINKMHSEGHFERLGLSNYPAWEVAQICEVCKRNGWIQPTVYQSGTETNWNDANFKALDILRAAIAPHGLTESEAALRWLAHHSVLKKEFGDAVIVGAGGQKHFEENLDALDAGGRRCGAGCGLARDAHPASHVRRVVVDL